MEVIDAILSEFPCKDLSEDYEEICTLGSGCFGVVKKVRCLATDKLYACKMTDLELSNTTSEAVQ